MARCVSFQHAEGQADRVNEDLQGVHAVVRQRTAVFCRLGVLLKVFFAVQFLVPAIGVTSIKSFTNIGKKTMCQGVMQCGVYSST